MRALRIRIGFALVGCGLAACAVRERRFDSAPDGGGGAVSERAADAAGAGGRGAGGGPAGAEAGGGGGARPAGASGLGDASTATRDADSDAIACFSPTDCDGDGWVADPRWGHDVDCDDENPSVAARVTGGVCGSCGGRGSCVDGVWFGCSEPVCAAGSVCCVPAVGAPYCAAVDACETAWGIGPVRDAATD